MTVDHESEWGVYDAESLLCSADTLIPRVAAHFWCGATSWI